MKKLLLVLMVVAMASFLFVGCLPGLIPEPEPEPEPEPDSAVTITVAGEYLDPTTGITYVQAASKLVTVTFLVPVAEEYGVQINGTSAAVTALSDRKVWTLLVDFSATPYLECIEECIIVTVGHPCCPDEADTYWKLVKPDGVIPCASFVVTVKDCGICLDVPGAEMSWTTLCGVVCEVPLDCCGDNCSGVGDWTFTADYDICGSCDVEPGNGCDITGAFECGCLSYADPEAVPALTGIHEVLVSIKDNVGNEFTDTWTLTFDTDELTTFVSGSLGSLTVTGDAVNGWKVEVDNNCIWTDCATCFPTE